jgi:hypothetical protein
MQGTLAELNNQLKVIDEILRDLERKFERGLVDIGRYNLLQKDYLEQRLQIVGRIEAMEPNAQLESPSQTMKPVEQGGMAIDPAALRRTLEEKFDLEEIQDLCFDLDIDFDALPGEGKKARELVAYCRRRDRLKELAARIAELRPGTL